MNSHSHHEKESHPQTNCSSLYPLSSATNALALDPALSMSEKHQVIASYLENIPAERKNRLAEIIQWQKERKSLTEREEELQVKLALYNEQIKQLTSAIETEKKSKERSRALIANLAQATGLNLPSPQPQQSVTAAVQIDSQRDPRLRRK